MRLYLKLLSPETHRIWYHLRECQKQSAEQHARLQALLNFCFTRVPYYQSVYTDVASGGAVEFCDLPILNKSTVRNNFADLIAVGRAGRVLGEAPLWIVRTSGSTGSPCSYLKSRADMLANIASLEAIFREFGTPRRGTLFDLGLHEPTRKLVEARMFPGMFVCWNFSGYNFDKEELRRECLSITAAARPTVLFGASSRLVELAALCRSEQVTLRPHLVLTTYEHLSTAGEALLRGAFDCPVVQIYGTAETGIAAWTCPEGRWHFDQRAVAAELVAADGAYAAPGEMGRIVLTPLDVRAMPLLRFDTGDIATCPASACPCGRNSPFVEHLDGRGASLITTATGRRFSPFTVLSYVDSLGLPDAQVVQRRPGELQLVLPAGTTVGAATLDNLARRICCYLEEPTAVKVSTLGDFVYASNGKRDSFVQVL